MQEMFDEVSVNRDKYDFVLLCGWSGQPHQEVISSIPVFSEHPATSDRYSLGTPLQNQIIDGVRYTKHRLVKVDYPELKLRQYSHEVDIDLTGNMSDILSQMQSTCKMLYDMFLDDYPNVTWKTWDAVEPCEMAVPRTPTDSLLDKKLVSQLSCKELYDKCRMLESPYPNLHWSDESGTIYIERVSFKEK